jgi:hypothetical protein
MKHLLLITLVAIGSLMLPSLSGTQAQTRSPRANSTEDYFSHGVARHLQVDPEGAIRDFDRAIAIATSLSPKIQSTGNQH